MALPIVIGVGLAVTACGSASGTAAVSATRSASGAAASSSPTASAVASSSPVPVPAGYKRIGGAAQGISVAAPASWVAIDPTKESIKSAASKAGLSGISAAALAQDLETLQKLHGVIVFDVKSAVDNPSHGAPNLSAYCGASGVTDVGAAGVPLLKTSTAAELEKAAATHITQQDVKIGGVPGVETFYQLHSSSVGTIYGSQVEVLPKPDKACFVTATMNESGSGGRILSVAAATAQFS